MAKEPKSRMTSNGMLVGGASKDSGKMEREKPTVRVTEKDLPAIKKWELGKKYNVKARIEMVSHSKGDTSGLWGAENGQQHEARIKIHAITPSDNTTKDSKDDVY